MNSTFLQYQNSKLASMVEYIKQYEPLNQLLFVNTTQDQPETTSINTVYSDYAVQEYTCGDSDREFIFAIKQTKTYDSDGTSDINEQMFNEVQEFMNWIDQQNILKNFPQFPENCTVYKIENLQNMPYIAGVDEQNTAVYMFQCRVLYSERRI